MSYDNYGDQVMHDAEMLDTRNDDFGDGDDNDDNDGWGVDSDMYTTTLHTNQLTAEQIATAIRLEREILAESQGGGGGGGGGGDAYEYAEDDGGGGGGAPARHPGQAFVDSPEEAMRLLAQRKGVQPRAAAPRPQQQAPPQPAAFQQQRQAPPQQQQAPQQQRPYGTAQDEIRAYHELCKQYRGVQAKLSSIGEPTPAQKKGFLQNLTRGLIKCLRYPVPAVRAAISNMFLEIGWDVRRNRSPPNIKQPPAGAMLKELLAKTVRHARKNEGAFARHPHPSLRSIPATCNDVCFSLPTFFRRNHGVDWSTARVRALPRVYSLARAPRCLAEARLRSTR
jgi:hypothetical protein